MAGGPETRNGQNQRLGTPAGHNRGADRMLAPGSTASPALPTPVRTQVHKRRPGRRSADAVMTRALTGGPLRWDYIIFAAATALGDERDIFSGANPRVS